MRRGGRLRGHEPPGPANSGDRPLKCGLVQGSAEPCGVTQGGVTQGMGRCDEPQHAERVLLEWSQRSDSHN